MIGRGEFLRRIRAIANGPGPTSEQVDEWLKSLEPVRDKELVKWETYVVNRIVEQMRNK